MSFKLVFKMFLLLKFWVSGFFWRTLYKHKDVVTHMHMQLYTHTSTVVEHL